MRYLKNKKSLTLIEVVISLSLTGIIISFLWQTFFNFQKQILKIEKSKETIYKKMFFQQKISHLFSRISLDCESQPFLAKPAEKGPNPLIILHVDHPIDPDPDYSGKGFCGLFHAEDKGLYFIHFGKNNTQRQELLYENVQSILISCFDEEKKDWQTFWDKDNKLIPCMIKMSIFCPYQEDFVFFPTQHIKPINLYSEK